MSWVLILQIIWEIIKLLAKRGSDKAVPGLLARLREAKQRAKVLGDTSELEKLRDELAA